MSDYEVIFNVFDVNYRNIDYIGVKESYFMKLDIINKFKFNTFTFNSSTVFFIGWIQLTFTTEFD